MDEKFAKIFDLAKKDHANLYTGDDIHMGSVAPYGISSGLAVLDLHLGGRGGIPASKVIEFYGKPFCGKTTLALQHAAEVQKRGGLVVFLDTEKSFDPLRAKQLGVNVENIHKPEVDTVESIFKILEDYLGDIEVDTKKKTKPGYLDEVDYPVLFIVDSITGVPTIADLQGEIENEARVGHEAKMIKRGLRRINPILSELKCKPSIIFINHAIAKIGGFGPPGGSDSGGGNGIKYYASIRIELAHLSNVNQGKDENKVRTGQKVAIGIKKLKGGHLTVPSFTEELTNKIGFDKYESLKEAMCITHYANRPKSSQTLTIRPDTEQQEQIRNVDFVAWVDQKGYDEVYGEWRRWAIANGWLLPWGS